MNYNLTTGISLDNRNLTLTIPNGTTISQLKYIARTDNVNNYIAENDNKGFIHYVEDGVEVTEVFYLKDTTNLSSVKLPEVFGTIIEIDNTAVLYQYITRTSHEKVYVVSEDFAKRESMDQDTIKAEIEETVRGYGVPIDGVMGFDGTVQDVPDGYEVTDNPFVTTEAEIKNTYNETNPTESTYSCYYVNTVIGDISDLLDTINGEAL